MYVKSEKKTNNKKQTNMLFNLKMSVKIKICQEVLAIYCDIQVFTFW